MRIYLKGDRFRLRTTYTLATGEELPKGLLLIVTLCGDKNCLFSIPGHARYEHQTELVVPRFHLDSDIFEYIGNEPRMPLPKTLVKWYDQIKPHVGR